MQFSQTKHDRIKNMGKHFFNVFNSHVVEETKQKTPQMVEIFVNSSEVRGEITPTKSVLLLKPKLCYNAEYCPDCGLEVII